MIREDQHQTLTKLSETTGESRSYHVRRALDFYFEEMRTRGLLEESEKHKRRPA